MVNILLKLLDKNYIVNKIIKQITINNINDDYSKNKLINIYTLLEKNGVGDWFIPNDLSSNHELYYWWHYYLKLTKSINIIIVDKFRFSLIVLTEDNKEFIIEWSRIGYNNSISNISFIDINSLNTFNISDINDLNNNIIKRFIIKLYNHIFNTYKETFNLF